MKKLRWVVCAVLGMLVQTASAAPIGWYDLQLTWRDGSFSGKMFYDSGSPYQATRIDGTLVTLARSTGITDVWNVSHDSPVSSDAPWVSFTNRTSAGDPLDYDSAFYLVLHDLGTSLTLHNPQDQGLGLYDWSNEALFTVDVLSNSPLLSWRIEAAAPANGVPEPSTLGMLAVAGLSAAAFARRRHP